MEEPVHLVAPRVAAERASWSASRSDRRTHGLNLSSVPLGTLLPTPQEKLREHLLREFQTHGWFVHMFVTNDQIQRQVVHADHAKRWYPSRKWVDRVCDAHSLSDVPLNPDCGPYCMGFSYLPPYGPMLKYSSLGAGLVLSARPSLWNYVKCASVSDSNSVRRVPCGESMPHGGSACRTATPPSETCKLLRAGCGIHAYMRKTRYDGRCDQPYFCTNRFWFDPPLTAHGFLDRFRDIAHLDNASGQVVCKFRNVERDLFEQSLHMYMKAMKHAGHLHVWENEVNLYIGNDDKHVQSAVIDHLQALLYDRSVGTEDDRQFVRKLQRHLQHLGKDVPIIDISMEQPRSLKKWDSERSAPMELTEPPYAMRVAT